MLGFERREKIITHIKAAGKVIISELATYFNVSEETIRRDLKKLEKEGMLTRFHGGASTGELINNELPYQARSQHNIAEKKNIATKLMTEIEAGQTLFVDSSSTVIESMNALNRENKAGISIITNSVSLLHDLRDSHINVLSTGGELRGKSNSLVGAITEQALQYYYGDMAIFGCKGLNLMAGITESNEAENQVKRYMSKRVKKIILLADHTKFDQVAFIKLFNIGDVNCIITDKAPSKQWQDYLAEKKIRLIY